MKKLTRKDLVDSYIKYFESKGHVRISAASLIPENNNSVLFNTAGMQQLVPYLLGNPHPKGKRLVSLQPCIRTNDIESVGDSSHLTFFEMLGNWSLGDYFKDEAIQMSYEYLTSEEYLGIPKEKLAFTVFAGSETAPKDLTSFGLWKQQGIEEEKIFFLGKDDNWWEMGDVDGPCGPDSEMFYDSGKDKCNKLCSPACSCGKYLEIWNDVFMEYESKDGVYYPLENKNVDTGMGVERVISVLNGCDSVYEIDVFSPLKKELESITGKSYIDNKREFRIIMDHIRSSVFILGERVKLKPNNVGAGYILRRLIRRMVRIMILLGVEEYSLDRLATLVIDEYKCDYPHLEENKEHIYNELFNEYNKFQKTLSSGMKMYKKMTKNITNGKISAEDTFKLFDTFGFPYEMTLELATEDGLEVDEEGFKQKFREHQEKSKSINSGEFKGGLIDSSEESIRYHTTAHILLAVLKEMYGKDTIQKGQNITPERLRFDFNLDRKMTDEEKDHLVFRINEIIAQNLEVKKEIMSYEEAKSKGVEGIFTDKYGEEVSVYSVGDISSEMCGGPHVNNTKEIGKVKLVKESSSSAGVRRLKIVFDEN